MDPVRKVGPPAGGDHPTPGAGQDRAAQRLRLAQLLGRLLARHWLRGRHRRPPAGARPNFLAVAAAGDPVYCLPEAATRTLALPRGKSPALLDEAAAAAERAFTALCGKHHAVGSWQEAPVCYAPLSPPPAAPTAEQM